MYNIRDGRGFVFPQSIRAMQLGIYNLTLLDKN